jgi:hypothetical protein
MAMPHSSQTGPRRGHIEGGTGGRFATGRVLCLSGFFNAAFLTDTGNNASVLQNVEDLTFELSEYEWECVGLEQAFAQPKKEILCHATRNKRTRLIHSTELTPYGEFSR